MYELTLIVGRVGRNPELRMTPHGLPVTNFSVAANHRYTDP
jgi:single-stranded DNA-binding protein